eukprot:PhM_4_TR3247/c0_g1_i1/m.58176
MTSYHPDISHMFVEFPKSLSLEVSDKKGGRRVPSPPPRSGAATDRARQASPERVQQAVEFCNASPDERTTAITNNTVTRRKSVAKSSWGTKETPHERSMRARSTYAMKAEVVEEIRNVRRRSSQVLEGTMGGGENTSFAALGSSAVASPITTTTHSNAFGPMVGENQNNGNNNVKFDVTKLSADEKVKVREAVVIMAAHHPDEPMYQTWLEQLGAAAPVSS